MRRGTEEGHLKTKERGLRRHQPGGHRDLGLRAPRIVRKQISVVEVTPSVVLCDGGPGRLVPCCRVATAIFL